MNATVGGVAPARRCAYRVLRRVFEHGAYADRALRAEAHELDPRDRALATALAYGAVQRRATLDHVAQQLAARALDQLDPQVVAALRLGLQQLLFLDRVADHAAVNDSVELVKREGRGGATLVNAVLRRAAREGRALLAELHDHDPEQAALKHSVPVWLARLWWDELGAEQARELLQAINAPAEAAVRVNTIVASPQEVIRALPVAARPAPGLQEGLVLDEPWDVHGSELFARGALMPQSRASIAVAPLLDPQPGERVLDLCAAPGAKATHLAALMQGSGTVVALERNPTRARELERNCRRLGADAVRVLARDATAPAPQPPYDRVLVDPPCSGLGTLQARPDLRWRATPAQIGELARLQGLILQRAAAALAPSGTLVYSVCTISRREGAAVINELVRSRDDLTVEDLGAAWPAWREPKDGRLLQTLPYRDRTDGFFIARLRRR